MGFPKMKLFKIISVLLSMVLLLDATGMQTLAADSLANPVFELVQEDAVTETTDGEDIVSTGDYFTRTEEDTKTELFASGTYYGMEWELKENGVLTISGIYSGEEEGDSWQEYAEEIISASISAVDVKSMKGWFQNHTKLKQVDFTKFDCKSVKDTSALFYGCSSLENIQFGSFNTVNVTDMSFMFYNCKSLKTLDVSGFNTRKVTSMRYMFGNCSLVQKLSVDGFVTSRVTDMTGMFSNCGSIASLKVSGFSTARVTDMSYMFAECYALKNLDVSNFDTSAVTNMSSMFQNCSLLTELDVSGFQTGKTEHMSAMFYGCNSLTKLDLSSFDTSCVTNMTHMFSECRELTKLVFGELNTVWVTDMDCMFYKCYKLQKLDLSSFNLLRVESAENMLSYCGSLEELKTPLCVGIEIPLPYEMQDEAGKRYRILPQKKYDSYTMQCIPYGVESIPDQVYTGEAIRPEVVVVKDGEILAKGVDYTLAYRNNVNVADADEKKAPSVIVKGIGRYSGSFTGTFNIVAKEITDANITVSEMITTANNKLQTLRPMVSVDGKKLTFNKDYVLEYPDKSEGAYKKPGRYEVVIRGKCNYSGVYTTYMVILGEKQIKASDLTVGKISACNYMEGEPAKPVPVVKYGKKELVLNKDYSVTYIDNEKPGKATLVICGLENTDTEGTYVCGTLKKSFTIRGKQLKQVTVKYVHAAEYTGQEICPKVTLTDGEKVLCQDADYTVEYQNNTNVGSGKIILKGCGGYTGVLRKSFSIKPEEGVGDLLDIYIENEGVINFTTGGAKPAVRVKYGSKTLRLDVDYTVSYANNEKAAKANAMKAPTVIIKGKGNYKFQRKETFTIMEKSLNDKDIYVTAPDKYVGAKDLRSQPVVTDAKGNTLVKGVDYKITGYKIGGVNYNKNNIPGDATRAIVTIRGKGGYSGEVSVMYRITAKNISQTKITAQNLEYTESGAVYTTEMIKLGKLVLTDKKTNKELAYGSDYEIVGYKNNKKCGYATVMIKGMGDYGGIINVKFKVVKTKIPL